MSPLEPTCLDWQVGRSREIRCNLALGVILMMPGMYVPGLGSWMCREPARDAASGGARPTGAPVLRLDLIGVGDVASAKLKGGMLWVGIRVDVYVEPSSASP